MTHVAPGAAIPPYGPWPRRVFLVILIYAACGFGAIDMLTASIVAGLLAALAPAAALREPPRGLLFALWIAGAACAVGAAGAALIQSLRWPVFGAAHPAWTTLAEALSANHPLAPGALSVAPEQTRAAIVALAPLLGFLLTLSLHAQRDEALRLLRRLHLFAAAVAGFGMLQHILTPTLLIFAKKEHYLDSLTAVFVNRNSAGTFLGVGAVLGLGLSLHLLRAIDPARLRHMLTPQKAPSSPEYRAFVQTAGLTLLLFVALFLTQSRGAVGATFVAALALVALSAQKRMWLRAEGSSRRLATGARFGLVAAGVAALFFLLAGRTARRLEVGDDESRFCVFASTLQAARDNWPLGSGFATFETIFPGYRDAACAGVTGVWEAAHNFYLEGLQSMGAVFLLVLAIALIALISTFVRGLRTRRESRFAPAAGVATLVLVGIHSAVDFSLQIPGVALFVAAVLGACSVVSLVDGKEANPSAPER